MDADKMIKLSTAVAERQSLEDRVRRASGSDRKEMERLLNGLNSQIARLQQSVLGTYRPDFVVCRDVGHTWREQEKHIDDDGLHRTLRCSRCTMRRVEIITRFGALAYRNYERPDDYLMPKGAAVGRSKTFWRGLAYMQASKAA
jgi:hypothetical protein